MPQVDTSAIQAYLQSKALSQAKERAEQMHEEAQSQLEELHKYHSGLLEQHQQGLDLQKTILANELRNAMIEHVGSGAINAPPTLGPAQGNSEEQQIPGSPSLSIQPEQNVSTAGKPITLNFPEGSLPGGLEKYLGAQQRTVSINPLQARAEQQAGVIKTIGGAQAEVAGETEKAKGKAGLEVANSPEAIAFGIRQHGLELDKLRMQGANLKEIAKIHGMYGLSEAQTHANATIQAAHIANDLYQDPDVLQGSFNGVLSGQGGTKELPPKTKLGVEKMFNQLGWVVPDEKANKDLTNIKSVEDLLGQYMDLAKNYSKDGPQGGILKATAGHIPGVRTDIRTKMDSLMSQGGILARQFDPQSRIAKSLIEQQQAGLFDPYATVQQNLDKIEAHRQTINTEINALFSGMPSQEKNVIMGRRGIHLFGGFEDGQAQTPQVPVGRVAVINPKGEKVHIPQTQLQDALKQGYKPLVQ